MRHMGKSGKTAIGAALAALALLVLAGATMHETVALWFLAAAALAYVACVAEVIVRRRHKTLLASGVGSILFIAFGIAFLRQWGLAFNPDPEALSTRVDAEHPDLYFYLSAGAGAATLLLLLAGTVLPGRRRLTRSGAAARPVTAVRRPAAARQPASRQPASRQPASRQSASRQPASRQPAARQPAALQPASRQSAARPAARPAAKPSSSAKPAAKSLPKPAPKSSAKPSPSAGRTSTRR